MYINSMMQVSKKFRPSTNWYENVSFISNSLHEKYWQTMPAMPTLENSKKKIMDGFDYFIIAKIRAEDRMPDFDVHKYVENLLLI